MSSSDSHLDRQLRDVRVPADLPSRIRAGLWADEDVDQALRRVELPEGLQRRLDDAALDAVLRETPAFPPAVAATVRRRVWEQCRRRRGWRRLAVAATWLIAASLTNAGGAWLLGWTLQPRPAMQTTLRIIDTGPLALAALEVESIPLEVLPEPLRAPQPPDPAPEITLASLQPLARGPVTTLQEDWRAAEWGEPILVARYQYYGYPPQEAAPLRFEQARPIRPAAAEPPVEGYDRAFHWRHGVSPWVLTAAAERRRVAIPLRSGAAGYDQARWLLESDGRLPGPDEILVEDMLGAVEFRYPLPAPGALGLRTAGGPSVFGPDGAGMLMVGVQAGALPTARDASPSHLTVAIDLSPRMGGPQLAEALRALGQHVRMLGDRDRISIVAVGERAELLCEQMARPQAEEILQALVQLRAQRAADWGSGLPYAAALAASPTDGDLRRQLLILGAESADVLAEARPRFRNLLETIAADGVAITWASIGVSTGDAWRRWLAPLAECRDALQVDQLHDILESCRWGQAAPVATEVALSIEFDPRLVRAYRVLGHDGRAGLGEPPPARLRAGQQASVLVELHWTAAVGDDVGWAEVRWRDAAGQPRTARQRLSRLQFASSYRQAPPSLQAAILTAETAQILQHSAFARGRGHALQDVLRVAATAGPALRRRADFQAFVAFVNSVKREHFPRSRGED